MPMGAIPEETAEQVQRDIGDSDEHEAESLAAEGARSDCAGSESSQCKLAGNDDYAAGESADSCQVPTETRLSRTRWLADSRECSVFDGRSSRHDCLARQCLARRPCQVEHDVVDVASDVPVSSAIHSRC